MAHVLRITDGTTDTSTWVTLTSGDMYLAEYTPQTSYDLSQPIRERAKVGFITSIATIQNNVHKLNRLFYQAANYDRNRCGNRIYVEFDPDTSGTAYRSMLYSGAVHPPDEMLGGEWGAHNIEMDLEWTRWPFWEGALTQIPLTNASSSSNTGGITVTNHNDAGHENWVSLASSDITGDLPAEMKLQMTNSTTDSSDGDEIYVFHNVYSNPSTFRHFLEAETSTDSHVTSTTDATSSGAAYAAIAWDSTGATKIAEWNIPTTDMSDAAGGRFALLARWRGQFPYSDCWLRFKLETITNAYDIWTGNLTLVSTTTDGNELTMLDTLRLPPYLDGQTNLQELNLTLYGTRNSTDNDIALDYIQLSPISGDSGWLRFVSVARGVPANRAFIYDGTEGISYRLGASSEKIGEFTQYGGPILLTPNVTQKLYFLSADYTGTASITQQWTVKVWYRPRRSSI